MEWNFMAREQDSINSHPLDKYIDENSANESEIIKVQVSFLMKINKKLIN